jgi:hypothetical protein
MCPETAFSETPLSNHVCPNWLHAMLIVMRASKLSTQLRTKSTGPSVKLPCLGKGNKKEKVISSFSPSLQ